MGSYYSTETEIIAHPVALKARSEMLVAIRVRHIRLRDNLNKIETCEKCGIKVGKITNRTIDD
jgi:hypothetical protein